MKILEIPVYLFNNDIHQLIKYILGQKESFYIQDLKVERNVNNITSGGLHFLNCVFGKEVTLNLKNASIYLDDCKSDNTLNLIGKNIRINNSNIPSYFRHLISNSSENTIMDTINSIEYFNITSEKTVEILNSVLCSKKDLYGESLISSDICKIENSTIKGNILVNDLHLNNSQVSHICSQYIDYEGSFNLTDSSIDNLTIGSNTSLVADKNSSINHISSFGLKNLDNINYDKIRIIYSSQKNGEIQTYFEGNKQEYMEYYNLKTKTSKIR